MGTVRSPAGTRIFMQTGATGATQALTAISKANPAVITYSGTDPANGNYCALTDMFGMTEFEESLVKVANVSTGANTFEAEDQNSSSYGDFISGNMAVLSLTTELGDGTGFEITGFEQQFAEYNLLRDRITRRFPTTVSGGGVNLPMIWDPTTATAQAIQSAADTAQRLGFKVLFPDGLEMLFFGYVGASGMPRAQGNNSIMETSVSISMATRPRFVLP